MSGLPEPEVWLGLAAITLVAGLVRGFSGFGAGLVMAPVYALLVGPSVGVPILILLDVAASVRLVPEAWRHCRWRIVLPLGLCAALTIPFGVVALGALDPVLLERLISATVLALVALLASGWRYRGELRFWILLLAGATSGLLTGVAGIGGPPVILLVLATATAARFARSDLISFFAITQTVAVVSFFLGGFLASAVWILTGGMAVIFLLAIEVGSRLFRGADETRYRQVAFAVLAIVAGGSLLWSLLGS